MLSEKTIEIVKSTVPILEKHGTKITKIFYQKMFSNHPELLNIFNHANQKKGRQPTALFNSVYAAAKHIDNLETILPVVKQIGHKHRSLGVKAEQYPIVGKHLLLALKEVLGDEASDDVIDAWKEAYDVIADVFIQVEEEMYQEAENQPGGWRYFRDFTVVKKVKESDVITSFYLKPADGGLLPPFKPGQYISVKLDIEGETYTHIRQYSLSDKPGKDYYRISVKREDECEPVGIVSTYLHEHVKEGDTLPISAPAGDFYLDATTDPLVLISGGVGITPMMSMLHSVVAEQPERKVTFIHAARNGNVQAFRDEIEQIVKEHPTVEYYRVFSDPTEEDLKCESFDKKGYIDLEWLQSVVKDTVAQFYFCGPVPFMKSVHASLKQLGVPKERIHYEFFGPALALAE